MSTPEYPIPMALIFMRFIKHTGYYQSTRLKFKILLTMFIL